MNRFKKRVLFRWMACGTLAGAIGLAGRSALAQVADQPDTAQQPSGPEDLHGAGLPVLEEMSRETRALYQHVAPGIVRVEVPLNRAGNDPLARWEPKVGADLVERLESSGGAGGSYHAEVLPETRPALTNESHSSNPSTQPAVEPNVLGVVIDDHGHIMLPTFVDPKTLAEKPIPAWIDSGMEISAHFIGSDKQTNITVLQIDSPLLRPVRLGNSRPLEGSLVMVIPIDPAHARLGVWLNGATDTGLVVSMNGTASGFARRGQFLCGATCLPVVRQLIEHGHVDRAYLGVRIEAVPVSQPGINPGARAAESTLPMVRITEVVPSSAAARAGLQEGDYILELAGQAVDDPATFGATIAQCRGKTELQIMRSGQRLSVTVDLEAPGGK